MILDNPNGVSNILNATQGQQRLRGKIVALLVDEDKHLQ